MIPIIGAWKESCIRGNLGIVQFKLEPEHLERLNEIDAVVDAVTRQSATDSLDMFAFMRHIVFISGAPDFTKIKPFTKAVSYHEIALGAAR